MPSIQVPIFQGGRLAANLDAATADRDIALAQYEKAIQAGFREVADALVLSRALAEQRRAQESLVEAAANADRLSRSRYEAGATVPRAPGTRSAPSTRPAGPRGHSPRGTGQPRDALQGTGRRVEGAEP